MNNLNIKTTIWVILIISFTLFITLLNIPTPKPISIFESVMILPRVVTIDLILFFIFRKLLWKCQIFKNWLVPFPNLNGTWKGYINTNCVNVKTGEKHKPIPVILTLKQSFTNISCVMRTAEMNSYSFSSNFIIDKENQILRLIYSYNSIPNQTVKDRSPQHFGTISFDIITNVKTKKLVGDYWTGRGTTGRVELRFWKKEHLEEYPVELGKHPVS